MPVKVGLLLLTKYKLFRGTPSYPKGNRDYPRRQVENEIQNNAKAS